MVELRLDRSWVRPGNGPVALGGSPLTMFRLTDGGRAVVDAIETGRPLPAGHRRLTDRLVAAGAVHPVVESQSDGPADVSVVIPIHDEDPVRLAELVSRFAGVRPVAEVIVVDDASRSPLPDIDGADVVRLETNRGPGGARDAGVDRATTPFVLFVDADVEIERPTDLVGVLRAHLDDDHVALAAPRVRALDDGSTLAAFEQVHSPLDLGDEPARIRSLTRVSYVPAAVVMVRRSALIEVGGFDPGLRFGEDVDLVWRLDEAGHTCRYEPAAEAHHRVRGDLRSWVRQRRQYGTAAAPLARRHGDSVAPLRVNRWSAAAWGLAALGRPVVGAGIAAGTTVVFARMLGDLPRRWTVAGRYAGLGNLHAGRLFAAALTRTWWPLALVAALVSRRARRVVLVAALVPSLVDWVRLRPRLDPLRYLALRLLDDVAYGTGVWQGCAAERSAAALAPSLTRR